MTIARLFTCLLFTASGLHAQTVTTTGSVSPSPAVSPVWNVDLLSVGETGNGWIDIADGGQLNSGRTYVGSQSGRAGFVTVSGAGSIWNFGELFLGFGGAGTILVSNGGQAIGKDVIHMGTNRSISGTLTVTGTGSFLESSQIQAGGSGGAIVTVEAGGYLNSKFAGYISSSGRESSVTVTGANSLWSIGAYLYVGSSSSTGKLTIANGGKVTTGASYISSKPSATSMVTVTGSGSRFEHSSDLVVGKEGTGTLTIEAGGVVTNNSGYIGNDATGTGSVTVSGPNSQWINSTPLYVGHSGSGTLHIANGGHASATTSYLGYAAGSSGSVTVSGADSVWTNSAALHVGENGAGTLTAAVGGTVRVGNGGGTLVIAEKAGSSGTVNIGAYDLLAPTTAGVLDLAAIGFGEGAGVINFNQINTITIGQTISGKGNLVQRGTGTTVLTGSTTLTSTNTFEGVTTIKQGTLRVEGAGGKLTQPGASVFVGELTGDHGHFAISDGAIVSSSRGYIGLRAGSEGSAVVQGVGSQWQNGASLAAGYEGTGYLQIRDGAKANSSEGYVGFASTGTGTVDVEGAGSLWQNGPTFYVGYNGHGTLNLFNGGTVSVNDGAGTVRVAASAGSTGTLNFGAYDLSTSSTAGALSASEITFGQGVGVINFNQSDELTLDELISGNGKLVQRGRGKTILTGNNTYTGPTMVEAGTLLVEGSITGDVTVKSGATFGGGGKVGDVTLESGSTLLPGANLEVESFIWNSDATLVFDLGSTTSDLLTITGNLFKGGNGPFAFAFEDAGWEVGQTYTLLTFAGTGFQVSDFSILNGGGFDGTFAFEGNSLTFHLVSVPEPSTFALLGVGLLGLGSRRWSCKRPGTTVSR